MVSSTVIYVVDNVVAILIFISFLFSKKKRKKFDIFLVEERIIQIKPFIT